MKKLLLLSAIAVFGLSNVNAQDEKTTTGGFADGDIYASGNVGFSSTSQGDAKMSTIGFSPSVGMFINENIAIELGLTYVSGTDDNGVNEEKTSTFGGTVTGLYYFTPANQFSFVVAAGVTYGSTTFDNGVSGSDDLKSSGFGVMVSPGVNYFVSDCIALRAGIGALSYSSNKVDVSGAEASNTFALNLDLTDINFGITYKFN